MRDLTGTQQAGFEEFNATKHMEGEGEAPKIHTLKVADDPEELVDGLPEWMDGNDLISCENEAPEILIAGPDGSEEGAILRRGSKLVVGGSSKMGKTWSLIDLGLAVAAGGKWLGHFQCRQGTVLYVNLELRKHTAGKRMRWIGEKRGYCRGTGLRPEVSKAIKTWNLRGQCYDLIAMLSTARMRLKDKDAPKFALIILDPIYKTYGDKDENSAGDMAALMLEIERFADECNAAIAFAAHFSKGNQSGKEAIDRISGSGVMARDPDAIVTFTQHEEEGCFVMESSLREFAPVPATVFEWACPVLNPRDDLDSAKLRQPGKAGVSKAPERADAVRAALVANGGELPSRSALTAAIKSGGTFPDNNAIAAWRKCLKDHPKALAEVGVEVVALDNGKDPIWRLKMADRKPSNDPF